MLCEVEWTSHLLLIPTHCCRYLHPYLVNGTGNEALNVLPISKYVRKGRAEGWGRLNCRETNLGNVVRILESKNGPDLISCHTLLNAKDLPIEAWGRAVWSQRSEVGITHPSSLQCVRLIKDWNVSCTQPPKVHSSGHFQNSTVRMAPRGPLKTRGLTDWLRCSKFVNQVCRAYYFLNNKQHTGKVRWQVSCCISYYVTSYHTKWLPRQGKSIKKTWWCRKN